MSDNVISFEIKKRVSEGYEESEEIFWFITDKGKYIGFLKNKETKEIGFVMSKEPMLGEGVITHEDVLVLCDDDDDFIYNKMMSIWY